MYEFAVLQTAYDRTTASVEALTSEDLHRPTPCAEWDVRALVAHIVAGTDGLVAVLRGEEPDWGKDSLGDDPLAVLRQARDEALAAWSEPGAVETPSRQMPGMRVVDFAMADAVAHSWDLAAALGRPFDLPEAHAQLVFDRWEDVADTGRQYGVFGPRVEVPDDAPVLVRLLGLFGRDPGFVGAGAAPVVVASVGAGVGDNSGDASTSRG